MDWKAFWEAYPRRYGEREFRKQVGRTANGGVPTPEPELERVVEETVARLELGPGDRLLDLCCGNGFLTRRLGEVAGSVVGVDFSEPMLELARRFHGADNVAYRSGSVLELDAALTGLDPFSRVAMLESLHYFEPPRLRPLLEGLLAHTTEESAWFFSGVPDARRKDAFFDTPERRAEHERRKAAGTDGMGHWWDGDEIEAVAASLGLECRILPQSPDLHTAYYRFDVLVRRG